MIGILLTGTIIPNSNFVQLKSVKKRREDYLNSLKYYSKFGYPVWFLENSKYDLNQDDEFSDIDGVTIIKFAVSDKWKEGKGYQEFEMIDKFVINEDGLPDAFIKVSGRYIIEEFEDIISECELSDKPIIANFHYFKRYVDTYLLYFRKDYYKRNLTKLYENVNDEEGRYIENVYYDYLEQNQKDYRIFLSEKNIIGTSGSSGVKFHRRKPYKLWIESFIRRILVGFNMQFVPW